MTPSTSAVAVCCWRASIKSSLRSPTRSKSRVFSMAMTACSGRSRLARLFLGEGADPRAKDRKHAEELVLLEHRHGHQRSRARDVRYLYYVGNARPITRTFSSSNIAYLADLVGSDDLYRAWSPSSGTKRRTPAVMPRIRVGYCDPATKLNFSPSPKVQDAKIRLADARGVLQHLGEYRLQIARRRTHDLEHFGRRRLLLQRFLWSRRTAARS